MGKYCWDFYKDAELWTNTGESIDDCIEQAKRNNDVFHTEVYIGECLPFVVKDEFNIDAMLENLEEAAFDFAGEAAESWLPSRDMKHEEKMELQEKLAAVIDEYLQNHGYAPSFYQVTKVAEYDLYEEGEAKSCRVCGAPFIGTHCPNCGARA